MSNPRVGDKVAHNCGREAEVIELGSIATASGLAILYNVKFLDGSVPVSVNCLREEFRFPISA